MLRKFTMSIFRNIELLKEIKDNQRKSQKKKNPKKKFKLLDKRNKKIQKKISTKLRYLLNLNQWINFKNRRLKIQSDKFKKILLIFYQKVIEGNH